MGCGIALFLAALPYTPWWMNTVMVVVAVAHIVSLFSKRWGFYATLLNAALSAVVVGLSVPYVSAVGKAFAEEHILLESLFVFYMFLGVAGVLSGERYISLHNDIVR